MPISDGVVPQQCAAAVRHLLPLLLDLTPAVAA